MGCQLLEELEARRIVEKDAERRVLRMPGFLDDPAIDLSVDRIARLQVLMLCEKIRDDLICHAAGDAIGPKLCLRLRVLPGIQLLNNLEFRLNTRPLVQDLTRQVG